MLRYISAGQFIYKYIAWLCVLTEYLNYHESTGFIIFILCKHIIRIFRDLNFYFKIAVEVYVKKRTGNCLMII